MPRRAASPAVSEAEVDILGSLYPGEDASEQNATSNGEEFDVDDILNGGGIGQDGGDEGDEAFIALQQAASFRKASNLKGRTVKKGGGFQAMGKTKGSSTVGNISC
jgi:ATP-dependent RNA helicase DDX54/DBP10